ncbi:hypothetical protein TorRG33x02_314510, partial [Trema orientale]
VDNEESERLVVQSEEVIDIEVAGNDDFYEKIEAESVVITNVDNDVEYSSPTNDDILHGLLMQLLHLKITYLGVMKKILKLKMILKVTLNLRIVMVLVMAWLARLGDDLVMRNLWILIDT